MNKNTTPKFLLIVICHTVIITSLFAQPNPPQGYKWEGVPELTDEFDKWDNSKWFKPLWNYGVPVKMTAKNSGVSKGKLWIKATLGKDRKRWFETSRVQSTAQIKYPMYTESRIRTAHISAYNTFWMNNGDANNRDEIDIIENNSNPSCKCQPDYPWQMSSQYFITVNGNNDRKKGNFDNRKLSPQNKLRGVKWNQAYHIVGAWWIDKNNVQFYLDGEPAGKVTTKRNFTRDLNLIWDLWTKDVPWLGGLAHKKDLTNSKINTMYVDWVHTYKLKRVKTSKPKGGKSVLVIEAEKFINTGGIFNDRVAGGPGRAVKNSGTEINFVNSGDWVEYKVNVPVKGKYSIQYLISTPSNNAAIDFMLNDNKVTSIEVPNNGSWNSYKLLSGGVVRLSSGQHVIKLKASGRNEWQWNLDKFILKKKK
ncbi:carbohydrate-binding protein [Aquimarina agarivorans]|uniref:carbohydrate-binding protein n=1 Tax=Aquimarina agarivorans TaxID=980584 RepID=UPI000248E9AC|nr:carbohydrate-binding protein [Aquimarina agarivorans]